MKRGIVGLLKNEMLLSILMVVLGIVLLVWPGSSLEVATRVIGIALIIGGLISLLSWNRDRKRGVSNVYALGEAVICLLAGLAVLIFWKGIVSLMPRIVGILVVINGIINLVQTMQQKNAGARDWIASLVLAVVTIVAGLIMIFAAFTVVETAVRVIGVALIYNGASNLWISYRASKAIKH